MRRIALAFVALLFLSALGVGTLVSMLFGGRGLAGTTVPVALILLAGVFLAGVLAVTMRRVGGALGDVVEAANRLASGDYAARVAEHGPPRCGRSDAPSTAWRSNSNLRIGSAGS